MSLIATARAMDDDRFTWRVRAALLTVASEHVMGDEGDEQAFASHVLRNPMQPNTQLETLSATDPAVSSKVIVDELNMVSTEGVEDGALLDVARRSFSWLARLHAESAMPSVEPATFVPGPLPTGQA